MKKLVDPTVDRPITLPDCQKTRMQKKLREEKNEFGGKFNFAAVWLTQKIALSEKNE